MLFLTRVPAPPLSCYVELFWYCENEPVAHKYERVLPNGRSQLIIDLTDGFSYKTGTDAVAHLPAMAPIVVGLQTRYSVLESASLRQLIGLVFRPGGARALVDVPAGECSDQVVTLDSIWGSRAASLRDRLRDAESPTEKFQLLERALLERVRMRPFELHAAVRHALAHFERAPHICSVIEVARQTGLSRRRLAELFREQVGLTPKLYCRVLRFQRVVSQIASGAPIDWTEVALAGGYCDQPHFAHEFHDFSGISPGTYTASERISQNHVVIR